LDEPISLSTHGLDVLRRCGVIFQRLPNRPHGDLEHGFRDIRSCPELLEEFLFANQLSRALDSIVQQGKRAGLQV
jgi:hypothetical protein